MVLNPNIILSGRTPDPLGAMGKGMQLAQAGNQMRQQNALTQMYQQHGPGLLAGDSGALNALAGGGFVPEAMSIKGAHHGQNMDLENLAMRRKEAAMQAETHAFRLVEAGRAREVQEEQKKINKLRRNLYAAQTDPATWVAIIDAAMADETDPEDLAFYQQLRQKPGDITMLAMLGGADDGMMSALSQAGPEYSFDDGYFFDKNNPQAGAQRIPGMPEGSDGLSLVIGMDAQGNPIYATGAAAESIAPQFGTKSTNDIETRIINSGAMLSRLNDTQALYKPEYQQIFTRASNTIARGKDKLGIASPEEQQSVAEYAAFRTEAFNNLNTTLKELSGAAVTPQEAERLLEQLPNVGTGIFDGDSPSEFQSKLQQSIRQQKLAIARYNLWLKMGRQGNPWDLGELDNVPGMINAYGKQLEEQFRSQGYTDEGVVRDMVMKQLHTEVGI